MKYTGRIKMKQVKYFTINLPDEFVQKLGKREISVSLVYDPPVRKTRADYFGVQMEFHLFKNHTLKNVMKKYNLLDLDSTEEEKVPKELDTSEIILKPKIKLRKKSNHQKGTRVLSIRSKIDNQYPLVLAVISQQRWELGDDFEQNFAVVVTLKHEASIDLYNKIMLHNQTRVRV